MSNIYAIQHPHGFFKIGLSKNPIKRYNSLQTGTPYELVLHTIMSSNGDARQLEASLHKELERYHWRGEWFNVPESILTEAFESRVDDAGDKAYHLQKIEYVKSSKSRKDTERSKQAEFQTANEL